MFGVGNFCLCLDHRVFAVGSAVAAAEELHEVGNGIHLSAPNGRVQGHQTAATLSDLGKGLVSFRISLEPFGAFGHEKDNTIRSLHQFWTLLPSPDRFDAGQL